MKFDILLDSIEFIDEELINEAEYYKKNKAKNKFIKYSAIAACLCILIAGTFMFNKHFKSNTINDSLSNSKFIDINPAGSNEHISDGSKTFVNNYNSLDINQSINDCTSGNSDNPELILGNFKSTVTDEQLKNEFWRFSLDNLKYYSKTEENLIFSPVASYLDLTMLIMGTNNNTYEKLRDIICPDAEKNDIDRFSINLVAAAKQNQNLSITNSIWINDAKLQNNYINQKYINFLNSNYEVKSNLYIFNEDTRNSINQWIYQKSNNKIIDILPELNPDSLMVILSAIFFDAEWNDQYENIQINENGKFANYNGTLSHATLLSSIEQMYFASENATGFLKYYQGKKYAFFAILPDKNISLSEYIDKLMNDDLYSIYKNLEQKNVEVNIPCFKSDYLINVKNYLSNKGIKDLFEGNADISTIFTININNELLIDSLYQKSYMELNKTGTNCPINTCSPISSVENKSDYNIPQVYLIRPFIYIIMDVENEIPLFLGTVNFLQD